jgi:hypothetical protein
VKRRKQGAEGPRETQAELRRLRKETRTALDIGVAALAPPELLERLAMAAGLLDAVAELPADSPPVVVLVSRLFKRSLAALEEWERWEKTHLTKNSA